MGGIHYEWKCPFCPVILDSRRELKKHKQEIHNGMRKDAARTLADRSCQYCGHSTKYLSSLKCHERYCVLNPNRDIPKKPVITPEMRENMHRRALEGYKNGTYHGWMNCHSSKPSYPERFFMKVIKNNFDDIHYKYNLLFYQYKLDFAWPHKKRCIEIDGSQHERNQAQHLSDIRKDKKLAEQGWHILRIRWRDMYNNPVECIRMAQKFIDDATVDENELSCYSDRVRDYTNKELHSHKKCSNTTRKLSKSRTKSMSKEKSNVLYCLDKNGRPNAAALGYDGWRARLDKIINSGVDLMQYGWVERVHNVTGYTRRVIYQTINHFSKEMDGKYFKRTNPD